MTDDKVHGFGPSYSWWHPDDNLLKLAFLIEVQEKYVENVIVDYH